MLLLLEALLAFGEGETEGGVGEEDAEGLEEGVEETEGVTVEETDAEGVRLGDGDGEGEGGISQKFPVFPLIQPEHDAP